MQVCRLEITLYNLVVFEVLKAVLYLFKDLEKVVLPYYSPIKCLRITQKITEWVPCFNKSLSFLIHEKRNSKEREITFNRKLLSINDGADVSTHTYLKVEIYYFIGKWGTFHIKELNTAKKFPIISKWILGNKKWRKYMYI